MLKISDSRKTALKAALFILVLIITFFAVQDLFKVQDWRIRPLMEGLRRQPKNSLDCIFVGGSQTYAAWSAPFAYKESGMTSWTYALPHAPCDAAKYYIIEARKRQPDAVYVIAVNGFRKIGAPLQFIHHSADYMPLSMNKINMVRHLGKNWDLDFNEQLEMIFPIIRFHSGWNELDTQNFSQPMIDVKSAMLFSSFLIQSSDVTEMYAYTEEKSDFKKEIKAELDDLVSYLKKENVKATFVFYPQALSEESEIARNNGILDYLKKQGCDVLDLMSEGEDMDLDYKRDFYNYRHTNVHGSLKLTHRLTEYLMDRYGLTGKHTKSVEKDWDECCDRYYRITNSYLYDFEYEHAEWDPEIGTTKQVEAVKKDGKTTVTWNGAENADGYLIYRKFNEKEREKLHTYNMTHSSTAEIKVAVCHSPWKCIGEVKDGNVFVDKSRKALKNKDCKYSVVPYRDRNGRREYGSFKYLGTKSVKGA